MKKPTTLETLQRNGILVIKPTEEGNHNVSACNMAVNTILTDEQLSSLGFSLISKAEASRAEKAPTHYHGLPV